MTNANDIIMGISGAPAAKFPTPGTLIRGTVTNTDTVQQRDFKTKEPLYWSDKNRPTTTPTDRKVMQAVVTVQTEDRDPDDPDDDGQRRLYVNGRNMRDAVREAVIKAGVKMIEVGGTLAVQYTGDGQAEGDQNPPKLYAAEYRPPAVDISMLGEAPGTRTAPTTVQRPTSLLADEAPF